MKKPISFVWRYIPWHIILLVASLTALMIYASVTLKNTYMERTTTGLKSRSQLLSAIVKQPLKDGNFGRIQTVCDSIGTVLAGRFTIVLKDGTVVGDSDERPDEMENHADRPEIINAYDSGMGISSRFSSTLKISMLYVALPLTIDGEQVATVRSSLPLTSLSETMNGLFRQLGFVLIIVVVLAGLLAAFISNIIKKPINKLIEGSSHFSKGDLDYRVHISDPLELNLLGRAMNRMAIELQNRITTMSEYQQEMESVLSDMSEALILIDMDGKIIRFNRAASQFFRTDPTASRGRILQEIVRNMDLLRFVQQVTRETETEDHETVIQLQDGRFLLTHGRVIRNDELNFQRILLVLNDITHLKRLENVRKEFVANVSHELKTPITAISASVETLMSGALEEKEPAERFLNIIRKHSIRLHSLVEDLLQISRFEDSDRAAAEIELEQQSLLPILREAIQVCKSVADKKSISLVLNCVQDMQVEVNTPTIEQAIINLLDNAIKYSPSESNVEISCASVEGGIAIAIKDQGEGIGAEHLDRIFERFYRVDNKSRSREQGGTGLGLSIVKHAVLLHGGSVEVESTPGSGSTFIIKLPAV